jgi:hypothetical protein
MGTRTQDRHEGLRISIKSLPSIVAVKLTLHIMTATSVLAQNGQTRSGNEGQGTERIPATDSKPAGKTFTTVSEETIVSHLKLLTQMGTCEDPKI